MLFPSMALAEKVKLPLEAVHVWPESLGTSWLSNGNVPG